MPAHERGHECYSRRHAQADTVTALHKLIFHTNRAYKGAGRIIPANGHSKALTAGSSPATSGGGCRARCGDSSGERGWNVVAAACACIGTRLLTKETRSSSSTAANEPLRTHLCVSGLTGGFGSSNGGGESVRDRADDTLGDFPAASAPADMTEMILPQALAQAKLKPGDHLDPTTSATTHLRASPTVTKKSSSTSSSAYLRDPSRANRHIHS